MPKLSKNKPNNYYLWFSISSAILLVIPLCYFGYVKYIKSTKYSHNTNLKNDNINNKTGIVDNNLNHNLGDNKLRSIIKNNTIHNTIHNTNLEGYVNFNEDMMILNSSTPYYNKGKASTKRVSFNLSPEVVLYNENGFLRRQ